MRYLLFLIALCCACTPEPPDKETQVTDFSFPGDSSSTTPFLFTDSSQTVYLSWTETKSDTNKLLFSRLEKHKWTTPRLITQGKDWFVNWADYPVFATHEGKNLLIHHLEKRGTGTFEYDILLSHSSDSGLTWSEPFILHEDSTLSEHGFVSIIPYGENFLVTWLDGRNTMTGRIPQNAMHEGSMTLRAAVLAANGQKLKEWELDDRVCDCCQTSAVVTSDGAVVAYRNRSEDEIRDIYVVKLTDSIWSTPQLVSLDNWKIDGCPVNGPRMSARGNNVVIGWFTAAEGDNSVNISFSTDGGNTFSSPFPVHEISPIGRVDVEWLDSNSAMISWMEGGNIVAARVSSNGTILKRYVLAASDDSRSSGFPQITSYGTGILVAWTDTASGSVKTRFLEP